MTFTAPIKKADRKIVKYQFPKMIFGRAQSRPYGQRFIMENVELTIIGDSTKKEQLTFTFEGDMPCGKRQSFTFKLNSNRGYKWLKTTFPAPIEYGSGMENLASIGRILEGKYEFSDRIRIGVLHQYISAAGYHEYEESPRELQSLENWWGVSDRKVFIDKGHIKI